MDTYLFFKKRIMGKDKKKDEGPHCPCSIETDLYEEWKKTNKPKDKLEASKKKKSEDDKETSSKKAED